MKIALPFDRDAGISALTFHPNRRMAVSTSYGGDFKVPLEKMKILCKSIFCNEIHFLNIFLCLDMGLQ